MAQNLPDDLEAAAEEIVLQERVKLLTEELLKDERIRDLLKARVIKRLGYLV